MDRSRQKASEKAAEGIGKLDRSLNDLMTR
jgi:hypothetical protein